MASAPVKILMVVPPAEGGMAAHVLSLLENLDASRFQPALACAGNSRLARLGEQLCLPVYPLAFSNRHGPLHRLPLLSSLQLRKAIKIEQPHLLHAHSWGGFVTGGLGRLAYRHTRLLCTIHSYPAASHNSAAKALGRLSDHIICVSAALQRLFPESFQSKISVIPNGIPPALKSRSREEMKIELGISKATPVVGVISRFAPQKGLEFLLEASALVKEAHFVIAGDGPLRLEIEARAQKLWVADRFHFLGRVPSARALLPAFDVLALPSLSEGSSLAVMEAMAAGLPVVASRLPALEEIVIPHETGLLVPPGDSRALAEALRSLIHKPVLRMRMGQAAVNHFDNHFTLAHMLAHTTAVYEQLLNHRAGEPH